MNISTRLLRELKYGVARHQATRAQAVNIYESVMSRTDSSLEEKARKYATREERREAALFARRSLQDYCNAEVKVALNEYGGLEEDPLEEPTSHQLSN